MFNPLRLRRLLAMSALAGVALCSTAAHALVTIYPGAMCSADGPVDKRENGELWNKSTGIAHDSWVLFHCPVVLTQYNLYGTPVHATVHVRLNNNVNAEFYCVLRSTRSKGDVHDWGKLHLPSGTTASNGGFGTGNTSVGMPSEGTYASVHLRCRVPNGSTTGGWAGIISYKIEHS